MSFFYKDMRIRSSMRNTPVPPKYNAYIFHYYVADSITYKVILAPSLVVAWQRIKEFSIEQGLDCFWQFTGQDDFEVVYLENIIPR